MNRKGCELLLTQILNPNLFTKVLTFKDIMLKDGCICYSVKSGNCVNAIT